MKTILICHDDALLTKAGFARWLASFTDLVGIVVIRESRRRIKKRIRTEMKRVGLLRFIFDVLPYRVYNRIQNGATDQKWEAEKLAELDRNFPELTDKTEIIVTVSPNSKRAKNFITRQAPDMVIARCKTLLTEELFSIPPVGTFVMHPGICPEYRNAHGCFWALANDDLERVGMTLLKINSGVDTGPIYGYYTYEFDEVKETPAIIHHRVVYDNLDAISDKLIEIYEGRAETIDTTGRTSGAWGQPWLSKYLRWKQRAKGRQG